MSKNIEVIAYSFSPIDADAMNFTFDSEEKLEAALPYLKKLKPNGIKVDVEKGDNAWMMEKWAVQLWQNVAK